MMIIKTRKVKPVFNTKKTAHVTSYGSHGSDWRYGSTSCYSQCRTNLMKILCDGHKKVKSMRDIAIEVLAEQTRCQ